REWSLTYREPQAPSAACREFTGLVQGVELGDFEVEQVALAGSRVHRTGAGSGANARTDTVSEAEKPQLIVGAFPELASLERQFTRRCTHKQALPIRSRWSSRPSPALPPCHPSQRCSAHPTPRTCAGISERVGWGSSPRRRQRR